MTTDQRVSLADNLNRRQISSYEIFSRHIVEEKGEIVVEQVLSLECFKEWLDSRQQNIVHPLQSFRRALYAHLRGADNRRPFPEKVENAFLQLVRRDDGKQLWKRLFFEVEGESHSPRLKNFLGRGFHEAKSDGTQGVSKRKRKPRPPTLSIQRHLQPPVTYVSKQWSIFGMSALLSCQTLPERQSPWELVLNTFQRYASAEDLRSAEMSAVQRGLVPSTQAACFFLRGPLDSTDMRFNFSFLLPREEDCCFLLERPTASFVYGVDLVVTHEDPECVRLFGESIYDRHMTSIFASVVMSLYSIIAHYPRRAQGRPVWKREWYKRADGSQMLCLAKLVFTGKRTIATIQDQSDCFPKIMALPMLV